ncbi:MAG: T9SS type A sorting domain-containing protein [Calditrichaeota bacterium]|jgi:hypothetical protein|nr:T9SS type A sorting domain-containing protein [Calditrichota bacterium]MBT7787273.1 T9SS type A sorting domain-containing protein [Calditrichota bacterium]
MKIVLRSVLIVIFLVGISFAFSRSDIERANIPPMSGIVEFDKNNKAGFAGPVRDRVGPNVLVSDDENHRHQNETCVAINPADPNHILGGCNDYRDGNVSCGWFVSFDGGENWENGLVDGLDVFSRSGDPTLVLNSEGHAWYCGIHYNRNDYVGGIFVSHSEDGGLNWDEPDWVITHEGEDDPPFDDKPYLGIDNTGSEFDGNLYVSWTRYGTGQIYFSVSTDGGENWAEPLRLWANRGQGSLPIVGPDGELYVVWKDYTWDRVVGKKSLDGGESFGDVFVVAETVQLPNELPPSEFRTNSLPTGCVDISGGENNGRIYVAWADERSGDADILMCISDDGSENWSEPIRLNDDEIENGIDQFFPWMCSDPTDGKIYAIWYDRRLDEENMMVDTYGVIWNGIDDLPDNERITSESWDPGVGFNGGFIGDYSGIAALEGKSHPAWCDTRNDNQDIYWAVFDEEPDNHFIPINGNREHSMTISDISINGQGPEAADELAVFDSDGQVVGALYFENGEPYEFIITGNWASVRNIGYMTWRFWDDSENEELAGAWRITEGDWVLIDGGSSTVEVVVPPPDEQTIHLIENHWHLISLSLHPLTINPMDLFRPLEDFVPIVKNSNGQFLTFEFGFSNMSPFTPLEGYQLYSREEFDFTVTGLRLDPQAPIPLNEGWNIVPYLPDYELDAVVAFESIMEWLIIAKDEFGRFMIPRFGFFALGILISGRAYQVNVSQDCELMYPEEEEFVNSFVTATEPQYYCLPRNSERNMSVLITGFENGSTRGEIGAFTPSGILCGAIVVNGSEPYGIAIWGRETEYAGFIGAESGDKIEFRYINGQNNREYILIPENGESIIYQPDGFSAIKLRSSEPSVLIPTKSSMSTVSPNPFNQKGSVTISLSRADDIRLALYDLQGRSITYLHSGFLKAGSHQFRIDSRDLVSGLYLISLNTGGEIFNQRVVVLK